MLGTRRQRVYVLVVLVALGCVGGGPYCDMDPPPCGGGVCVERDGISASSSVASEVLDVDPAPVDDVEGDCCRFAGVSLSSSSSSSSSVDEPVLDSPPSACDCCVCNAPGVRRPALPLCDGTTGPANGMRAGSSREASSSSSSSSS